MEVVVDLCYLSEVLFLHFTPCFALAAVLLRIREQDLVDYNVVDVDLLLRKLNCKSFCLVHAQELWYTHSNERGLLSIFELLVDLLNLGLHAVNSVEQSLLHILGVAALLLHHRLHLTHHSSKLVF